MNPFKLIIMRPCGWILRQLYLLTGSYGIALILFAILIKLILLPVSMKSKKGMMKMSRLQPKLKALERKYAGDQQKYQAAAMALYREEGVSTMGSCLWSFIPILILLPLYYVIRAPLTYIMGLGDAEINTLIQALANLGQSIDTSTYYYQIIAAGYVHDFFPQLVNSVPSLLDIDFHFLGMNLSSTPQFRFWQNGGATAASVGLFLLPIISGAFNGLSAWVSQKLNSTVIADEYGNKTGADGNTPKNSAAATGKAMLIFMPLMSIYIGFVVPAGLSIYWIIQAIFTTAQELILTNHYRKVYDEEDRVKAEQHAAKLAEVEEKARKHEQWRSANPDAKDPNTSKKKLKSQQVQKTKQYQQQEKLAADPEAAAKKTEPKKVEEDRHFSGDTDRPFSRGRGYKAERYGRKDDKTPKE